MVAPPVSMVDRIAKILRAFEMGPPRLSLAAISELTGIPKTSTYRILQQLVKTELIERHEGQFRLGLSLFELGSLVQHRDALVTVARPYLQRLCAGGRFAAHLAILDGIEVVYLDKTGGRFAGDLPSRVGGRFSAHQTAVGKAILAGARPDWLEWYLDEVFDDDDHIRRRRLVAELDQVRRQGFSQEHGEAISGVSCVGAPITHRDATVAAISITSPTNVINVERVHSSIRLAAQAISRGLHPRYEALRPAS